MSAVAPLFHRFTSGVGAHVLVVPYSSIFDLPTHTEDASLAQLLRPLADAATGEASLDDIAEPAPQSLSLNVSSSCNLACTYCYAGHGGFGGAQPKPMAWVTADAAIDRLLADAACGQPVTIGFMGGEPFVNRALIHHAVAYACEQAGGRDVRFSVTTNGTLLRADDIELLRRHPFAVTVSLDGGAEIHDAQRPHRRGNGAVTGTWATAAERIAPLLAQPGRAKLSARVTVARHDFNLARRLEALARLGFPEIGFAPVKRGPEGSGALQDADWPHYLAALISAAEIELARARRGLLIRMSNLAVALKQIHRGSASPYPCGAGGGYFSVDAGGTWYACHRAIGNAAYALGSNAGLDAMRRRAFVQARHVHAQAECRSCWARYLCSGGCHQEAPARSAAGCDFIRAWLDFCLKAYCELGSANPSMNGEDNHG